MKDTKGQVELDILLADDDIDDCGFFKMAVDGFKRRTRFRAVHDGEQLMNLLLDENEILPDILFLDLNMPRKNGFECLAEIKGNKKFDTLPVIMYSTSYEQEVVNLLYNNGARYFIRKPSELWQFKSVIQQTLFLFLQQAIPHPSKENFVLTAERSFIT